MLPGHRRTDFCTRAIHSGTCARDVRLRIPPPPTEFLATPHPPVKASDAGRTGPAVSRYGLALPDTPRILPATREAVGHVD